MKGTTFSFETSDLCGRDRAGTGKYDDAGSHAGVRSQ